ncbi:MAG: hypothetical protein J6B18_08045 [Bacteroidaceae bacterium]|nr:hypothetical protein [Bacteroidaceae bacterium]
MKKFFEILLSLFVVLVITSCAHPTYITPSIKKNSLTNTGTFAIQNMDNKGQIEPQSLTAHYDGFDVRYKLDDKCLISFEIVNNTNKSLIIDKSKCYVLYNGYSTELFKDVRSSRSTTFNNVQDAINNVQTSDASITMTIPPYSKWALPLNESNVRSIKLPAYIENIGIYSISPYDNPETVEFVIPYTFDYSLANWDTSRNRVYVGRVVVSKEDNTISNTITRIDDASYQFCEKVLYLNKEEIDEVNRKNIKKWKRHRHWLNASHIFWGIVTLPIGGTYIMMKTNAQCYENGRPEIYNYDGTHNTYDEENAARKVALSYLVFQ